MTPFNDYAKTEIKERSNGVSELSGQEAGKEGMLICGHLDHTRNESYNNPEYGLRVTRFEECAYHQMHIFHPEKIGMKDLENRSTVMNYISGFHKKGFSLDEIREKIGEAIELWEEFLENKPYVYKNESYNPKGETPKVIVDGQEYFFKDDSYNPRYPRKKKWYTPPAL
jgi:hypothetical protein